MTRKISHWKNFQKALLAASFIAASGGFIASNAGAAPAEAIKLIPQQSWQVNTAGVPAKLAAVWAKAPANFYRFGSASVGKPSLPQALTMQLDPGVTIAKISSTPDFRIVAGGTCQTGHTFAGTCRLRVQFSPQGAGPRLGKLTFLTSGGAKLSFGLLGYSAFPVVSFIPSVVEYVTPTVLTGAGAISAGHNIAVDDGDNLYIADTGNGALRSIDSSGAMTSLASGYTGMWGVTLDTFGDVFFTIPSTNQIWEIYNYGPVEEVAGAGTDGGGCPATAPCTIGAEALIGPTELSTDGYNAIFFPDDYSGAAISTVQPLPANLIYLLDPFPYQTNPTSAMAADSGDNLYSQWAGSECEIVGASLYDAENSIATYTKVAGGRTCGFSGDGGKANGAEIGKTIGQIAFDLAGNMYFTDTANNRVRRVDAATGIIRTIAGNGSTGRSGNGGPATAADIGVPSGVAVDSQGQVYISQQFNTSSTTQIVRQLKTTGILAFATRQHATTSSPLILIVSNTGNASLVFTKYKITGTNAADFTIDDGTTNCNFSAGNSLASGQTCQIGVIFKPAATGSRSAVLSLIDNTVNALNKVTLTGTGS